MSETLDTRRRKRIVEHIISGFNSGQQAADFARSVKKMVDRKNKRVDRPIGKYKYHSYISAPNTKIAITERWIGPTILRTVFLGLKDQHVAIFITEGMRRTIRDNNLILEQEIVREKPQVQFVTAQYIPKTSIINKIG